MGHCFDSNLILRRRAFINRPQNTGQVRRIHVCGCIQSVSRCERMGARMQHRNTWLQQTADANHIENPMQYGRFDSFCVEIARQIWVLICAPVRISLCTMLCFPPVQFKFQLPPLP